MIATACDSDESTITAAVDAPTTTDTAPTSPAAPAPLIASFRGVSETTIKVGIISFDW